MSKRTLKIEINAEEIHCSGCDSSSFVCRHGSGEDWHWECTLFNHRLNTDKKGNNPERLMLCIALEKRAGPVREECTSCGDYLEPGDIVCEHCGEPTVK